MTKESEVKIISNIDKKSININKFKGIDCKTEKSDPTGSAFVKNFRFMHDGSLEKREGYAQLTTVPGIIRAVWTGFLDGAQRCYVLADNKIYEIFPAGNMRTVTTANTNVGEADFFYYRGELYLMDGSGICIIKNDHITYPTGYVPLVANMWFNGQVGEIYQPRNIMTDKARYSYVMGDDDYKLVFFDQPIQSIDSVYINGEKISSDLYFLVGETVASIYPLQSCDRLTVTVTYPPKTDKAVGAYTCTHATVFGGANNSRPFFWGNESNPSTMYSCGYVSESDLEGSQSLFPQSDYFYIPCDSAFTVGDGQFPIRAVSRHYDRLLIFTEGGTWMADSTDCSFEKQPLININMNVGVSSNGAATPIENQPCCVGNTAIWRWNSHTDELNDCNAYSISDPIIKYLPSDFFKDAHVFADRHRRELLFTSSSTSGTVWTYSIGSDAWSCFEGIYAEKFFDLFGGVGFFYSSGSKSHVYYFTKDAYTDMGKEITATYESNALNTASAPPFRLSDVCVNYSGGAIKVSVDTDAHSDKFCASLPISEAPYQRSFRANTGRAASLKLKITADGTRRQTLHSIGIKVK